MDVSQKKNRTVRLRTQVFAEAEADTQFTIFDGYALKKQFIYFKILEMKSW